MLINAHQVFIIPVERSCHYNSGKCKMSCKMLCKILSWFIFFGKFYFSLSRLIFLTT